MPGIVVVGSQWGDEGKGKIVDVLSAQAEMVVRYQGGNNAGHTLVVNGVKTILHLVPSGILSTKTTCVIASGVVIDVHELVKEIQQLKLAGILQNPEQLRVADSATVLLEYHQKLDRAREEHAGNDKIGTTGRGIGPAYEDRASRKAILMADLFNPARLKEKLTEALREKNYLLKNLYKVEPIDVDVLTKNLTKVAEELRPYRIADASLLIHKALKNGKRVIFEGAQAAMLDILHGTYPFVTSSSTLAAAASTGSGVGVGLATQKVLGVAKAYATRVGAGPFPTELMDELGERFRQAGGEYGSTTGRPRRCGWLDLVALKYAMRLNGVTNLALMKLDVLSGRDKIEVCTSYKLDGQEIKDFPPSIDDLKRVEPVFKTLNGWSENISDVRSIQNLPQPARDYIQFIGNELAIPIDVVSVGPGREQTLWIKPLFT